MIAIELFEDGDWRDRPRRSRRRSSPGRGEGIDPAVLRYYYNVLRVLVPLTVEDELLSAAWPSSASASTS